jgi:hypothetical protein
MKQTFLITILFLVLSLKTFSQADGKISQCPVLKITGPSTVVLPEDPWTFSVEIGGEFENSNVEYVWKTEGGEIVSGQGTKSISAKLDKCGHLLKATVEIKGLPLACPNTVSETGVISHNCELMRPFAFDGYGKIEFEEEKIRIDNLFKQFEEYPIAEGVIEIQKDADAVNRIKRLDKYLTQKNYDKSKISYAISDSGRRETWLWLILPDETLPDCGNCKIIKAEDTKSLKELFQSK